MLLTLLWDFHHMEELILPFISEDSNLLFIDSEQRVFSIKKQESLLVSKVLTKINQRGAQRDSFALRELGK